MIHIMQIFFHIKTNRDKYAKSNKWENYRAWDYKDQKLSPDYNT